MRSLTCQPLLIEDEQTVDTHKCCTHDIVINYYTTLLLVAVTRVAANLLGHTV